MSNFYIADLHLNHPGCIRMDERPFIDIEEMNSISIKNHNSIVRKNDDWFGIGDFSWGNAEEIMRFLKQMNGRKHLIAGNHDKFLKDKNFDRDLFVWIKEYAEINDNKRKVRMFHYPIPFYNSQYGGNAWMLYGHVHDTVDEKLMESFIEQISSTLKNGRPEEMERKETIPAQMINCFSKFSDFKPLTLDQWIENAIQRNKLPNYKANNKGDLQ